MNNQYYSRTPLELIQWQSKEEFMASHAGESKKYKNYLFDMRAALQRYIGKLIGSEHVFPTTTDVAKQLEKVPLLELSNILHVHDGRRGGRSRTLLDGIQAAITSDELSSFQAKGLVICLVDRGLDFSIFTTVSHPDQYSYKYDADEEILERLNTKKILLHYLNHSRKVMLYAFHQQHLFKRLEELYQFGENVSSAELYDRLKWIESANFNELVAYIRE